MAETRVIQVRLHAAAPRKPSAGAPCNGCGACCAAEPCPLSRFLLGHRDGVCPALAWDRATGRYQCGLVVKPAKYLAWWPARWSPLGGRLARRWIAAGSGCDFDAEIVEG